MLALATILFSVAAGVPGAPQQPEYVVYQRNMRMPDVPVVIPGAANMLEAAREREHAWFGIFPLRSYTHVIRYVVFWDGGHERSTKPSVNKYILQVALADDGSRAQVLLLESERPVIPGTPAVRRTVGWMKPDLFARLRQQVLQEATRLPESEARLERGISYCSHSTSTRIELHSSGPARIELTREADCRRPASTYAAGEHVIAAAEQSLGRRIERPQFQR